MSSMNVHVHFEESRRQLDHNRALKVYSYFLSALICALKAKHE